MLDFFVMVIICGICLAFPPLGFLLFVLYSKIK